MMSGWNYSLSCLHTAILTSSFCGIWDCHPYIPLTFVFYTCLCAFLLCNSILQENAVLASFSQTNISAITTCQEQRCRGIITYEVKGLSLCEHISELEQLPHWLTHTSYLNISTTTARTHSFEFQAQIGNYGSPCHVQRTTKQWEWLHKPTLICLGCVT